MVETLAQAAVVFLVCTALAAVVPDEARPARVLRVLLPLTEVVSALLVVLVRVTAVDEASSWQGAGPAAALVVVAVVVGIALMIWFLLLLWRSSRATVTTREVALR